MNLAGRGTCPVCFLTLLLHYIFSLPCCTQKISSLILWKYFLFKFRAMHSFSYPCQPPCFLFLLPMGLLFSRPSPVIKTSVEQLMQRPLFFRVFCLIKLKFLYALQQVTWALDVLLGLEGKLLKCRNSLKKKTLSCATHLNKCRMIPCFKKYV